MASLPSLNGMIVSAFNMARRGWKSLNHVFAASADPQQKESKQAKELAAISESTIMDTSRNGIIRKLGNAKDEAKRRLKGMADFVFGGIVLYNFTPQTIADDEPEPRLRPGRDAEELVTDETPEPLPPKPE